MKKWAWALGIILFTIGCLIFVELRQQEKICKGIIVKLDDSAEYTFFSENDIKNILSVNSVDRIEGMRMKDINLAGLEKRVLRNRLIKNCQIYEDLSGNLVVKIQQQSPLGRLSQSDNASIGGYVTDTGDIVQLSPYFTARTVVLSGAFFNNSKNLKSDLGKKLLNFLKSLQEDSFWKAQITGIIVASDGELSLIPQVGNHIIDFGLPDETSATKFEKLKIFYRQILPHQGWNKYKTVSVKFRNQIVCE